MAITKEYNTKELERTEDNQEGLGELSSREWVNGKGAGEISFASTQTTKYGVVAGSSPSLVSNVPSSNNSFKTSWSRSQKRGYHRIQSCLQYWQGQGFQVLWVMLSTAVGGDASKLAYHHQVLRQRVERKLGYAGLQHYQVRTSEGNGVLHVLWAWRADNGFRQRSFYVPQGWLSSQWADIHGAPIVWICRVRAGRRSRADLSRYCMAQYISGQPGAEYMSWSWGRTFGFPLVACWRAFKGLWSQFNGNGRKQALYRFWGAFLARGAIPLGGGYSLTMDLVRSGYIEMNRDFFNSWWFKVV